MSNSRPSIRCVARGIGGWEVIRDKCWIIFIRAERIIRGSGGRGLVPPFLSVSAPYFLDSDIPPVSLQMSLEAAGGSRQEAPNIPGIHFPALTFTQMGLRSSFVFIFSPPRLPRDHAAAAALSSSKVVQGRGRVFR